MPQENENLEYEYRKQRYDTYTKERDALRKDSLEVSGRYDQAILALAGGALALSITFMEKIAPHPVPWTFILLSVAWLCLIASVLLELYALATSQTVTNEQIALADEEYRQYLLSLPEHPQIAPSIKTPQTPEALEGLRNRTRSFNNWSRWLLSFGVFFLCTFSLFNLPYSGSDNGKNIMPDEFVRASRGSYVAPTNALPPPPPPQNASAHQAAAVAAPVAAAPAATAPAPAAAPAQTANQ
ncbi:MAG TPA: hypothetical protein VIK53_10065 [Verrucomicrobiae bacterium]